MKLFTQEIDRKLFSQYNLGSDLSKQMVVAKIFNPYGAGRWFLVNSDPQDPDYLWAIVDLFDVEVGSVSRTELESIRIGKHGLPLERDLYFKPINAEELMNGLMQGKYYKKGGLVNNQNKEMLQNQAKEFTHHSKELNSLVGKTKEVDAWVVAKAERATTDLSDITHYLDGRMEKGGSLEKMFEEMQNQNTNIRLKVISVVGIDEAHNIINKDLVVNPFSLIESAVRKGFITIDEIDRKIVNSAVQEAYDIDSSYRDSGQGISGSDMNAFISNMLNGAGIKVGVVNDRYTRLANGGLLETYKGHAIVETNNVIEVVSPSGSRFIIGLDDSKMSGSRKSIEMTRAEEMKSAREYIDWVLETQKGRMAKGGNVNFKEDGYKIGRPTYLGDLYKVNYNESDFMGNFGWRYEGKTNEGYLLRLDDYDAMLIRPDMIKSGERVFRYITDKSVIGGIKSLIKINYEKGLIYFLDEKASELGQISFDRKGIKALWITFVKDRFDRFEDGGMMAKGGKIKVGDMVRSTTFKDIDGEVVSIKGDMILVRKSKELPNGDYQHDVLRIDEVEKMAKGGKTDLGKYYVIDAKKGEVVSKGFNTEEEAKVEMYKIFEKTKNLFLTQKKISEDEMMEMGGKTTFKDKVNAISKRLEGTKVPTRLKKDYGATYDKKEAKQAGQRIAGSMIQKLKMRNK